MTEVEKDTQELVIATMMRMRELRMDQQLSQKALGELCNMGQSVIGKMESREQPPRDMTLGLLVKVAKGLGVRVKIRFVDNVGVET